MRSWNNLGLLLLGIWLIVTGLLPLLSINFPSSGIILALLAVAAGVLILLSFRGVSFGGRGKGQPVNLGLLLLGIWLILTGLLPLLSLNIPSSGIILALLAIAAGVLILLGR